jgi:ATP-binding protein involved in chromosome partitioning
MSQSGTDELTKRIDENLAQIGNRLIVLSGKGGVDKTTVAVNIALVLAQAGRRVGILDADIHGPNVPLMLGIQGGEPIITPDGGFLPFTGPLGTKVMSMALLVKNAPIIWRGPLKAKAIMEFLGNVSWGELDWLVIDAPPGTGDEPLSIAQLVRATIAIIITTPQEASALDARRAVEFARMVNLRVIGIVENMSEFVCPHCGKASPLFPAGGAIRMSQELALPVLARLPFIPQAAADADQGRVVVLSQPESPLAIKFRHIVQCLLNEESKKR